MLQVTGSADSTLADFQGDSLARMGEADGSDALVQRAFLDNNVTDKYVSILNASGGNDDQLGERMVTVSSISDAPSHVTCYLFDFTYLDHVSSKHKTARAWCSQMLGDIWQLISATDTFEYVLKHSSLAHMIHPVAQVDSAHVPCPSCLRNTHL